MADSAPIVVILAAGHGTRMKSERAKVLHEVAGRPLLFWPTELARALSAPRIVVVAGHRLREVREAADLRYGANAFSWVEQAEPLGTGHAVSCALATLGEEDDGSEVIILYADVPLLGENTIRALLTKKKARPLALVTTRPPNPTGYGRCVRDSGGSLREVVEEKDADAETKKVAEVNAGIYAVALGFLRKTITNLTAKNAQGELYLTDLVAAAAQTGDVPCVEAPFDEVSGVNDRVDLARVDAQARLRICERWMRAGVTFLHADTVRVDADAGPIGRDSEIGGGVELRAKTTVGERTCIQTGCVLTNCQVDDDVVIKPYSVLTDTLVAARAHVGPFAHCREGTELGEDVKVGNFVETKKAKFSAGAKASHLSYLGDAEVGAGANVGAGTITCNYDGESKNRTVIGEGAFIGSDTQLVAPVTIGKHAYVGAGSTITRDVPDGALAVTRVEQKHIVGYGERRLQKKK